MHAFVAATCAVAMCVAAVGANIAVSSGYGGAYHTYGDYRGGSYSARALDLPPPVIYYTPVSYPTPRFGYYASHSASAAGSPASTASYSASVTGYPASATSYSMPATGYSASTVDSASAVDYSAAVPSYSTSDTNPNAVPADKIVEIQMTMNVPTVTTISQDTGSKVVPAPASSTGYIGYGSGVRSSDFGQAGALDRSGYSPHAGYSGYASGWWR